MLSRTLKVLYLKYLEAYPEDIVSYGIFCYSKPMHIRSASVKDMLTYKFKTHLHAQWLINALIEYTKMQQVSIGSITDYQSFFDYLTADCGK